MAKSKKPAAAVATVASTAILVAVGELRGGGEIIADGQELTADLQDRIGLDAETIADLLERGLIAEVQVRAAEPSDGAAMAAAQTLIGQLEDDLAAANKRADDAEAKLAAANKRADEAEAKLAAATKPAPAQ